MGTRQEPSPWAGLGFSQQTHGWVLILKTLSSITVAEPYGGDWEQYIYEASRSCKR
jgi:hypothetical protein